MTYGIVSYSWFRRCCCLSETIQPTEQILGEGIAMNGLFEFLEEFSCDERGAAAAEYALLLAIIAAALAVAAGTLGSAIQNAMDNTSNCISEGLNCSP